MLPNLFKFATKELSQDAFIAWLASWASPLYERENLSLCEAAADFLRSLLALQGHPDVLIQKVTVRRQVDNIDVWIEVNESHLIIIEDKTTSFEHSNQLLRYRRMAEKWCRKYHYTLSCIYLKTYSERAATLRNVEQQGFSCFLRHDFLAVLHRHEVRNEIFTDFRQHLQSLEDEENAFLSMPPKRWKTAQWTGFYRSMELLGVLEVSNESGGFVNAHLGSAEVLHKKTLQMQIDQGKLCIKISEILQEEGQSEVRNELHHFLMQEQDKHLPIYRPYRFGTGKSMTLALVPIEQWIVINEDKVDPNATALKLSQYKDWLMSTAIRLG